MELFIRGVEIVIGQAESHHYGGQLQVTLEVSDDRDGPAGTDEDGVLAPDLFEGAGGGFNVRIAGVDDQRFALVDEADFNGNSGGTQGFHELFVFGEGAVRVHGRHQTHGYLGGGFGGDDGFGSRAGEAAGHAVNVERGPRPGAFEYAVAGFAGERGRTNLGFAVMLLIEGQRLPGGEFVWRGCLHLIVEAGNQNAAMNVLQLGDDMAERDEGVGRGAAVHAGVQIGPGSADFDFGVDHAAQADAEGGQFRGKELGVGDEREVRLEPLGIFLNECGDLLAADLFFALQQDANIDGQLAAGSSQEGFKSFDVHVHLALVINGAARVKIAVAFGGLKGRRLPLVQRVGGLHVVMAIGEAGGLALGVQPVGVDKWMARGVDDLDVLHADAGELGGEPLGGAADVGLVLGQSGDGGNAQEILQLLKKTGLVLTGVID